MKEKIRSFNRVTIHKDALISNYKAICDRAGGTTPVMAMVKADAYGHGMVDAAKAFLDAGCDRFGVAELIEAVALREAGIKEELYVTTGFDTTGVEVFFQQGLIPIAYDYDSVAALSREAVARNQEIELHVKVDTGMTRLGLLPTELLPFLDRVSNLEGIRIGGIMSHFPEADDPQATSTMQGFATFAELAREVKKRFGAICHIANSGAVLNFPDTLCDMVRAGIALYGYNPAGKQSSGEELVQLKPVMSFTSRVIQVKEIPNGTGISYGHTFVTVRPTRLAIVPVGYEDGYSRHLSNCGEVLINGEFAPIVGRVCMNMCMVDTTDIKEVKAGDEVVLLGQQGDKKITADDIADKTGTISYEVLCMLGNNNQREII